jgi:hypothetical protein
MVKPLMIVIKAAITQGVTKNILDMMSRGYAYGFVLLL